MGLRKLHSIHSCSSRGHRPPCLHSLGPLTVFTAECSLTLRNKLNVPEEFIFIRQRSYVKGWQMFTRTASKSVDRWVCFGLNLHSLIIVILVLRISFTLPIFKRAEEDNLSNMSLCVFIHIFEPLVESGEAHVRTELLEKDLYKNPAGWRCGLLTHPDALQHLVEKCSSRQKEERGLHYWDTLCVNLKFNQIGKIPFLHSRALSLCTVGEQTVVPHSWVCWSPVCE